MAEKPKPKVRVVKAKDKHLLGRYPQVKELQGDKVTYAVARGSQGYKRFKKQHETKEAAEKEAVRLAKESKATYLVLAVIAKVYGKPSGE